jgi:hypothetical protein
VGGEWVPLLRWEWKAMTDRIRLAAQAVVDAMDAQSNWNNPGLLAASEALRRALAQDDEPTGEGVTTRIQETLHDMRARRWDRISPGDVEHLEQALADPLSLRPPREREGHGISKRGMTVEECADLIASQPPREAGVGVCRCGHSIHDHQGPCHVCDRCSGFKPPREREECGRCHGDRVVTGDAGYDEWCPSCSGTGRGGA